MLELEGTGATILQLDRSSMITLIQSGPDAFVGYDTLLGSGEGDSIKEKFNRLLRI